MPYFIQFVKDLSMRVENVQKSTEDIKKKDVKKAEQEMNRPLDMEMNFMFPGMGMQGGPMAKWCEIINDTKNSSLFGE